MKIQANCRKMQISDKKICVYEKKVVSLCPNYKQEMNKWLKKDLLGFFKERFTWLLIALFFGLTAYAIGLFIVKDGVWHELCFQFGNVLIVGVVLGFLSSGERFLSLFQEAIQNVVFGKEFLANQKDVSKYWTVTSKQMFKNKFPDIHEGFLSLINSYFPVDEVSYYNDYEMRSTMEWVNEEQNIVKICDEVSFDLIADTENEFVYPLKNWFKISGDANEKSLKAKSQMIYFKVDGVERLKSITPQNIHLENGEQCEQIDVKLSGKKKYKINYRLEKTLNLLEDHSKGFRAKYIVKNCRIEYEVPKNVHIQFECRGTLNEFEDMGSQRTNRISKRYRGILLPQQGFLMALHKI